MRTHYDNLKVPRDATEQEIRAAYRRLSWQYHPDRNPSPDAQRIMQIINRAYAVLSDPRTRREHDAWIEEQTAAPHHAATEPPAFRQPEPFRQPENTSYGMDAISGNFARLLTGATLGIMIMGIAAALYFFAGEPPAPQLYSIYPTAPNGADWPAHAAAVDGYPVAADGGSAALTLKNRHQNTALFVQLYTTDAAAGSAVRTLFIPAGRKLTVKKLAAGQYFARYMRLTDGHWAQTATLALQKKHAELALKRAPAQTPPQKTAEAQ